MQIEPLIVFKGFSSSPDIEEVIRRRISRLERVHDRITSCRVTLELSHRRSRKGASYHVHIDVTVPGAEVVSTKDRTTDPAHENIRAAIRDSFDSVQHQLEDLSRKMSGHGTRQEPVKTRGSVSRLMPEDGYGFIGTADGREFFFRRESLTVDELWHALKPGTLVHFTEHDGEKGPYASAVALA